MTSATPSLPLDSYLGPHRLVKLLAVGGMAEIYLALTKGVAGFEKQLALKVIHAEFAGDKDFVQMLVDEAKLAVTLNHANIVQTFDLGRIGKIYFISMEYVDGADFYQILRQLTEGGRDVPIAAALFVVREVLGGLDYAHNKTDTHGTPLGIIHRDVSPQNILLSRAGEVKIADFGIAKAANVSSKTRAGVIKGKLVYMSPEQSWGEKVDQRTDIFSAGVVLYEALTGGSLYREQNPVKLLQRVRKAEIPPPSTIRPEIDPELDALVMKALSAAPEARFASAREYGAAIGDYLRRFAPEYGGQLLAELVRSVIGTGKTIAPDSGEEEERDEDAAAPRMQRNDFVSRNSMISVPVPPEAGGDALEDGGYAELEEDEGDETSAYLLLLTEGEPQRHELRDQFIIGRGGDLRLTDARVSRRHARLVFHEGDYLLEDLNSSNGTYVNDAKINGIHPLQHDDRIRIGPFHLQFMLEKEKDTGVFARRKDEEDESTQESEAGSGALAPEPLGRPPSETIDAGDLFVVADLGGERLTLPVGVELPLDQRILVGEIRVDGPASTIVRRGVGYWLEPAMGRPAVLLNGRPADEPQQLSEGDEVQMGPLRLQLVRR